VAFNQRSFRKDKTKAANVHIFFGKKTNFLKGQEDEKDNFPKTYFGSAYHSCIIDGN